MINRAFSEFSNFLFSTSTSIKLVLFIFICLVTNILASLVPLRLDMSRQSAYSLSTPTKKILSKVNKPIMITVYVSSDIPSRTLPLKRDVIDFLKEYKNTSGGKIGLSFKDPTKDNKAKTEAVKAGVPQIQFSEVDKDQYKVSSSFFGLTLSDGENTAVVPQVVTVSTLEYDVTSAIYKMTRVTPQKIALVDFPQAYDPREDMFTTLKRSLGKQFEIENIKLATDSLSLDPKKTRAALFIADGFLPSTKKVHKQLANYIENGGTLVVFADGVAVSDGLEVGPATHDLFDFFKKYGIVLNKNLALSFSAQSATFATGLGGFVVKYPLWVATSEFSKQTSDFINITQLMFPWASSVSIIPSTIAKTLVKSPSNSWVQTKNFIVIPNGIPAPQKNKLSSYSLIAESSVNTGRLLVIPSARFVREQYLAQAQGNVEFVVNVLNRYVSGGALSGIRARATLTNPLKPLNNEQKDRVRFRILGILPAIFLLLGGFRLFKRYKYQNK